MCVHQVAVRILCDLRFILDALAFLIHAIVMLHGLRACVRNKHSQGDRDHDALRFLDY